MNKSFFDFDLQLNNKGYKVSLLSKNTSGQFTYLVNKYSLDKYFDVQNTYDLRLEKKDIRTMQYVLKKYKVKGSEVVFVDDQDFNLPNAKKLGVHTHLYKNFKDFKTRLNKVLNENK
ncbi:HAD-IA family hydrolase [bacterium]|nr:HAD-IA family hydrolase [bacterium]